MKIPTNYKNKRLTIDNVGAYLLAKYKAKKISVKTSKVISNISPLLQDDYGGTNDCTLTSITTCVNFYSKGKYKINDIYNYVESIAKKHFYNANVGTMPFFIQNIYNKTLKKFPCSRKSTSARYLKLSFSFNTIKTNIDKNIPVIISMLNDGRDYYKNHSITIIGYAQYIVDKKTVNMLIVYDNWQKVQSYVDYNAICSIASLNY